MSNQLNANVTLFQNNNIGVVIDKESLSVQVDVLPGVQEFAMPTTAMISQELFTGDSVAPAKKRKRKTFDLELVQRRAAAATLMSQLDLVQDTAAKSRRQCQVRFKYLDYKYNDVPHAQLQKNEFNTKISQFCPLANDHSIYVECNNVRIERSQNWEKECYQSKMEKEVTSIKYLH